MRAAMRSLAGGLAAAVVLSGSIAVAQTSSPPASAAPGAAQPSANISDEKLDKTAAAVKQVTNLKQNYQQQMNAATAPADKKRIADEANAAFAKAVTDQGLSLEEYTSILRVAQNDPQVREKLLKRLPADN